MLAPEFLCFFPVCVADGDQFFAGPFVRSVVSFQGFDSRKPNPLYEADSVLDDVSGLVLVAFNALRVAVTFVKP
jgi:hypothetical protein